MENTSNQATLNKGREAFRQFLANETNPVKQEQLKEYIPYIDKAYDLLELSWYFQKALEHADAKRAFLEYQEALQTTKQKQKKAWKKRLFFLWVLCTALSGFTIWKGFQPLYVYTMKDGTEIASESYDGKHITANGGTEPLEFSHQKFEYINQPFVRTAGVLIGVISLGLFTHVKME